MFKIEGSICFMTLPPGMEPQFQLYHLHPDGSATYTIYPAQKYKEPEDAKA